jgi:hydrogenase nickel incorporation protein HypA/HybF
MHELPVTISILSIVLEHAKTSQASKISRINLTIGELSGIVPEYIELQFDMISKDTIAAGATLSIHQPPIGLRCRNCDNVFSPDGKNWTCPNCGEENIEIVSGRECFVESIEVG